MVAPNVLRVIFAVLFTAVQLGQSLSLAPNFAKAKIATLSILETLDRVSRIDPSSQSGKIVDPKDVIGKAQVKNGIFRYPCKSKSNSKIRKISSLI